MTRTPWGAPRADKAHVARDRGVWQVRYHSWYTPRVSVLVGYALRDRLRTCDSRSPMHTLDSVEALLRRVKYKGEPASFVLVEFSGHMYLQHCQKLPDSTLPPIHVGALWQKGRKWLLSTHMTDGEVLQTALMSVLAFEEHEAREGFTFDGKRIFSPHKSVAALLHCDEEKRA